MLARKSETVKVVVRCRPMSKKELTDNRDKVVNVNEKRGEIQVANAKNLSEQPKTFTFDKSYPPDCKQESIYDEVAYPIVESVLQGYNGTIFAYGQTGTGKTHTMEGNIHVPDLRGIIPRTFDHIFKSINGTPGVQFMVRASMFELYNEEIRDLLNKTTKKLEIREKQGGVYIKDLSNFMMQNSEELMDKLNFGKENRQVGATSMNQDSSRSHCVFSITIETCVLDNEGQQKITQGKLNLVDLAGSERQSKTHATGDRFKEAISINQSLTTLGNVISALVDGKSQHIPYRDSKLTRILQDSLGGNTKTVMVANIGPADYNYDETVTTLRYAWRAKSIKNKPKINEDPKDAMIRQVQEEINKLKDQLTKAAEGTLTADGDGPVEYVEKIVKVHDDEKIKMTEQIINEQKQKAEEEYQKKKAEIENNKNMLDKQKEKLLSQLKEKELKIQKKREQQEKLVKQIKKMEEKVVQGAEKYQEAVEKERQVKLQDEEILKKKEQEKKIQEELREKDLLTQSLNQQYNSQKEDAEDKTKRIQDLIQRLKVIESENKELDEFLSQEIVDLQERRRNLQKELKLKNLILEYFIPEEELDKLTLRAVFNEQIDDWMYPNLHLAGNILRMKRGGKDENPMEAELDDLKRMNIEGHPNMYYAYIEEGLIREEELEPQEKKKIEKKRKNRNKLKK